MQFGRLWSEQFRASSGYNHNLYQIAPKSINAVLLDADDCMQDEPGARGANDPDGAQPLEAPITVGGSDL